MKKYIYYTSLASVLFVFNGCTGPELTRPTMMHNPMQPSQPTINSANTEVDTLNDKVSTGYQSWQQNSKQTMQQDLQTQIQRTYYPPTPQKEAVFNKEMKRIALSTQNDPRYHRMSLDTPEKKAWFKQLMYRLWDRQITRDEFISQGITKYPTHRYEFEFIANGFQK